MADYDYQMMLLEQQNKTRAMMAQQYRDVEMTGSANHQQVASSAADAPPRSKLADFQMQLMLLEQQNKKRLMMARQDPDFKMEGATDSEGPT